ncbi:MAG TPA: DUF5615 family PIN-like protein [Lacipirellulaceae bacterium]|nr:DUF5615 family PIN-like protein [Lacipirellulaceae bacterium]
MSAFRVFTDEDIYGAIAPSLRRAGFDAVSTPEAGRIGETDKSQLRWAASQGYVFVTFNVGDFVALLLAWLQRGDHHAGIVVSQQRSIGDLLRRLINVSENLDGSAMRDRLEFLGDW